MDEPVIVCEGVRKAFSGTTIFRDLSFSLRPGEVLGIIGPSGAGKTTVLRTLIGFYKCDAGRVLFDGNIGVYESNGVQRVHSFLNIGQQRYDNYVCGYRTYGVPEYPDYNIGLQVDRDKTISESNEDNNYLTISITGKVSLPEYLLEYDIGQYRYDASFGLYDGYWGKGKNAGASYTDTTTDSGFTVTVLKNQGPGMLDYYEGLDWSAFKHSHGEYKVRYYTFDGPQDLVEIWFVTGKDEAFFTGFFWPDGEFVLEKNELFQKYAEFLGEPGCVYDSDCAKGEVCVKNVCRVLVVEEPKKFTYENFDSVESTLTLSYGEEKIQYALVMDSTGTKASGSIIYAGLEFPVYVSSASSRAPVLHVDTTGNDDYVILDEGDSFELCFKEGCGVKTYPDILTYVEYDKYDHIVTLAEGGASDVMIEGKTRTYSIAGLDYEITLVYVSGPDSGTFECKFSVNGEITDALQVGDTDTLTNGLQITPIDINQNTSVVQFYINSDVLIRVPVKGGAMKERKLPTIEGETFMEELEIGYGSLVVGGHEFPLAVYGIDADNPTLVVDTDKDSVFDTKRIVGEQFSVCYDCMTTGGLDPQPVT